MKTLLVKTNNKNYRIIIRQGLIKESKKYISHKFPDFYESKVFIITDTTVDKFGYANEIAKIFNKDKCMKIALPAGEANKSFEVYNMITNKILLAGIGRNDIIIAVGGGVIGDLSGFVASTLLRGVRFIQIPTSLLSQVDSSVGGKTAINSPVGKNLIGTFYQPDLVLIDPSTLKTLDKRNLLAGYGEIFKMGLTLDKNLYQYCLHNGTRVLAKDFNVIEHLIYESCKAKTKIVSKDEFDIKGVRAILNFGHTFAHVYEKMMNYDSRLILHGEAVSLGIIQATLLSQELGYIDANVFRQVVEHLKDMGAYSFKQLKQTREFKQIKNVKDYIFDNFKKDKKATNGQYNFVAVKKIGKAIFVKNIDAAVLTRVIQEVDAK
ncbi:MAG: 3-dehydroquinate synthase [Mycoplasmataceae bacterium]|jgi:3-dehydroquinate synthase|nr:3-dehydroquinate synthase [Mycoplasmataceae bacterium]